MTLAVQAVKADHVPLLQEGSYVLKTFSKGVTRCPLEKMACSPLNRAGLGVHARHCHELYEPIATRDGLAVWRYSRGLMLSPNPDKPFENADFTNAYVNNQRGLLAPVTREHHPGAFSKTHLWHSHLTAKQGTYVYYHTGAPMVPNYSCPETQETMEKGLFFEEIKYEAYVKHPQAIRFLMKGENDDAAMALAETEMALIRSYFDACKRAVPRPGMELWQSLDESVGQGSRWNEAFKRSACDFATLLGEEQMKMLVESYQYFVNPKTQHIGLSQLQAAVRMPSKFPWCKLAPVVANLTTTNLVVEKLTNACRGNAVPDSSCHALQTTTSLGESTWALLEESMSRVINHYASHKVRGLDSHTCLTLGCRPFFVGRVRPLRDWASC